MSHDLSLKTLIDLYLNHLAAVVILSFHSDVNLTQLMSCVVNPSFTPTPQSNPQLMSLPASQLSTTDL